MDLSKSAKTRRDAVEDPLFLTEQLIDDLEEVRTRMDAAMKVWQWFALAGAALAARPSAHYDRRCPSWKRRAGMRKLCKRSWRFCGNRALRRCGKNFEN